MSKSATRVDCLNPASNISPKAFQVQPDPKHLSQNTRIQQIYFSGNRKALWNGPTWTCMDICSTFFHMGMGQNHVALVNIKIGGKWMFIP
jgi:hypothetical protein